MIAHLRGREIALQPFGWTGRRAEWIALACLHGGIFTRRQWTSFLGCHHEKVRRAVSALVAQGVAVEEKPVDVRDIGRVCRIRGRTVYRALGAEGRPRRRVTSKEVLMRRLLSLDYVLDHLHLPWLPTELEKVAAFEALDIEHRILPQRNYRGAAGSFRRYFPLRLPVALSAERAVFVYVDPGHRTATALNSWGVKHRMLWEALRDRGVKTEVVAVCQDLAGVESGRDGARQLDTGSPSRRSGPGDQSGDWPDRAGHHQGEMSRVLEEYGGLQAAIKRCRGAGKAYVQANRERLWYETPTHGGPLGWPGPGIREGPALYAARRVCKRHRESIHTFSPLAMRTGLPAYPPPRQRLAAPPPGARWQDSHSGRDRERPPSPTAWCGRGAMCVFTLQSPPPWGSLPAMDPCGKADGPMRIGTLVPLGTASGCGAWKRDHRTAPKAQ